MNPSGTKGRQVVETRALMLHRVAYSESDWVVSLFTEQCGRVTAMTPGARQSKRRYAGGIEPFHGLSVRLQGSSHSDMLHLLSSEIVQPRHKFVTSLSAMNAGAQALGWLRRALPPMQPDESAWTLTQAWLDSLDTAPPAGARSGEARTAEFGFRLLAILGWALQLQHCVRCHRICPAERSSYLVLSAGGIVCRACGGTGLLLEPELRRQLLNSDGQQFLDEKDGAKVMRLVEATLSLHAGVET